MEIKSREQAIADGLKRYFTGKPCSKGHIAERRVANHSCLECHRTNQKRLVSEDPEYKRRQQAAALRWKKSLRGREICAKHNREKSNKRDPAKERVRLRELISRKRSESTQYRIKAAISRQIHSHMRKNGQSTSRLLLERCGYTIQVLKCHLERQFTAGMTWANYGRGGWNIDHIVPACSFDLTKPSEFAACWSLGNLRPMWGLENSKKSAKRIFLL